MASVFLTGSTGFIGGWLLAELLERGDRVRALVRPGSTLTFDLPAEAQARLEIVDGDLLEASTYREALGDCEILYHVAGLYSLWNPEPETIYRVNVEGTRTLLEAAREAGVKRVVHTSTVGTLAPSDGGLPPGDESRLVELEALRGHYKRSKWQGERAALEFVDRGLEVVVVHPSVPVGPGDHRPTPTGAMVLEFLRGRVPAYTDTGLNLVPVEDCARGHVLAAERGRPGERYILGGQDFTVRGVYDLLSEMTGIEAPRWRLPCWLLAPWAWVESRVAGRTGAVPRVPWEALEMARHKMYFSVEKARRELGYRPGDVAGALARAALWFYQNDYARPRSPEHLELLRERAGAADACCDVSR